MYSLRKGKHFSNKNIKTRFLEISFIETQKNKDDQFAILQLGKEHFTAGVNCFGWVSPTSWFGWQCGSTEVFLKNKSTFLKSCKKLAFGTVINNWLIYFQKYIFLNKHNLKKSKHVKSSSDAELVVCLLLVLRVRSSNRGCAQFEVWHVKWFGSAVVSWLSEYYINVFTH